MLWNLHLAIGGQALTYPGIKSRAFELSVQWVNEKVNMFTDKYEKPMTAQLMNTRNVEKPMTAQLRFGTPVAPVVCAAWLLP